MIEEHINLACKVFMWGSFVVGCIVTAISEHTKTKKRLKQAEQELTELQATTAALEKENQSLRTERDQLRSQYTDIYGYSSSLLEQLSFDLPAFDWQDQDDVSRLYNALRENLEAHCKDITATFISQSPERWGQEYITTLTSCECKDRDNHPTKPCKHMFALALKMNAELSPLRDVDRKLIIEYTELKKDVDKEKREIKKIVSTTSQRSPWLAKRIAEYYDQIDRERIASIPRSTKKEELDRLRREKKKLLIERNELRSQLDYLIHKFPENKIHMKLPPQI